MMYAGPLKGIDNPESPENPCEQATAHFAAGQLGERVRARLEEDTARASDEGQSPQPRNFRRPYSADGPAVRFRNFEVVVTVPE